MSDIFAFEIKPQVVFLLFHCCYFISSRRVLGFGFSVCIYVFSAVLISVQKSGVELEQASKLAAHPSYQRAQVRSPKSINGCVG